ncbi:MAG: LON peptidase substrate-binding domain-containing protein [Roseitalea sp.]|jgi:Lon protease-like protein|nr:LON peptidase substrate-binding domain-containing protein [Roseitalea sp.]MBO6721100.1 LON peptidase substrate-binding domain-containing protein [Roseitalea sp.]MBO6742828.1 LON peptidase substrate-binding domain-containing protein [Roseitalea sp.]
MQAGNTVYRDLDDVPAVVPVFPLSGALLLPGSQLPLNLFEPRYLAMFDAALKGSRVIGMVQPVFGGAGGKADNPDLCKIGCLGRVTAFSETGDGRCLITLEGICRFRIIEELSVTTPFRQCRIAPFAGDLADKDEGTDVDREQLLAAFRDYLEANQLEADWASVNKANNAALVNALSVMSPYGPAEKQALLEAPDLKSRAETLVAITEMSLARDNDDYARTLQ